MSSPLHNSERGLKTGRRSVCRHGRGRERPQADAGDLDNDEDLCLRPGGREEARAGSSRFDPRLNGRYDALTGWKKGLADPRSGKGTSTIGRELCAWRQ